MKKKFNSKISKALMCCLLTALFVTFQTNLSAQEMFKIGNNRSSNVVVFFYPEDGSMIIEGGGLESLSFEGWRDIDVEITDNEDGSYTVKAIGPDPYFYLNWLLSINLLGDETAVKITFEYKSNESVTDAAVFLFDYNSTHVGTVAGLSLPAASDWTYGEYDLTSTLYELNADYYAGNGEWPVFGYEGDFMRIDPIDGSDTYELTVRNLTLVVESPSLDGEMEDFTYETQPWAGSRDAVNEVIIRAKVSSIGASAFEGTGITKVDIPTTVTTISADAFKDCNGLTDIRVHYTDLTGITVDETAFAGITDLAAINLIVPACTEDIYQATAPWNNMTIVDNCDEVAIAKIPVESFKLSPNPTYGIVNIDNKKGEVIEICTISGSLLFKTNASVIDLSKYPSGVYLIKMGDKVGKLIKN
jgi:hypothetical protein